MNAFHSMRAWWQARNHRERAMLTLMLAALAAFAYWYALLLPMSWVRDQARTGYDLAASELSAVAGDAAAIRALQQQRPPLPRGEAFTAAILASARDAGVAVARQRRAADGALELGIDAVDAPALLAWLDALRRVPGIAPRRISIEKADGRLRVEAAFVEEPA